MSYLESELDSNFAYNSVSDFDTESDSEFEPESDSESDSDPDSYSRSASMNLVIFVLFILYWHSSILITESIVMQAMQV